MRIFKQVDDVSNSRRVFLIDLSFDILQIIFSYLSLKDIRSLSDTRTRAIRVPESSKWFTNPKLPLVNAGRHLALNLLKRLPELHALYSEKDNKKFLFDDEGIGTMKPWYNIMLHLIMLGFCTLRSQNAFV